MTYAELTQLLKDTLVVDETTFNANIPNFIKAAEADIAHAIDMPKLRKNVTSTLTASSPYLATPSDYLASYELSVTVSGSQLFLLPKDVSYIREAYPDSSSTGTPKFYAEFDDDTLILGPTPNSNLVCELHYFHLPASIVTTSTSWIGDNHPNALLYGSLKHGSIYLKKGEKKIKELQNEFLYSLGLLEDQGERRNNNSDSYRKGEKRREARE